MKANRHVYDAIFSVCVLYAAHGIFITIKDVYDYKLCGVKHTKSACLPIIESKSTIDHNQKLLQALDDGLRWVLSKNINNHLHFQMWLDANCTYIYISRCCFLIKHYR